MHSTYTYTRSVEFSDTDMAGIMHFSRYYVFMESAEHAFFRSLGFSIHGPVDGCLYGWPRIHAECSYRQPLRFEDVVEVRLSVNEMTPKTILYDFTFMKKTEGETIEIANGSIRVICVVMDEKTGKMKSAAIPAAIKNCITSVPQ
jgi:YbgC/YbaW family acyl-CoA thioester hydrolase